MTHPSIAWPAPISLGAAALRKWPEDIFIEELQCFISDLASSTETPPELSTMVVLSALSVASQGKYLVEVKPDYFEPVNVWTATALPSGSRKTAVLKAVMKPLAVWEQEQKRILEPKIKAMVSENTKLEMKLKEARKTASLAPSSKHETMQREIQALEVMIKELPKLPQLWTSDVTPENLATIMTENHECMGVLSDEGGIFDILNGRYSGGIPNLDLFLQAHAGSPVRVNRGSRPPIFLQHPCLTMGLTPQPSVLQGLARVPSFRGRGLLARFLYVIPTSNIGHRTLDAKPLNPEIENRYHTLLLSLLSRPYNPSGPDILKISAEAYADWRAYSLAIEIKMQEDGPLAHITDWASKLPGAIARIAGLMHISQHANGQPSLVEINQITMKAAIRLGHHLADHALFAFDCMGADAALDGARTILRWIERNNLREFTFRDCHYANKNRFKKADELKPSLEIVEDRYFILERNKEIKPYRPSRIFDVNPQLYETRT